MKRTVITMMAVLAVTIIHAQSLTSGIMLNAPGGNLGSNTGGPQPSAYVGVGTDVPRAQLDILSVFDNSINEDVLRLGVLDATDDYTIFRNGTNDNNEYSTYMLSHSTISRPAFRFAATSLLGTDFSSNSEPLAEFRAYVYEDNTATNSRNRPLFAWGNLDDYKMQLTSNGQLALGLAHNALGSTIKLGVKGDIELRSPSTGASDVVDLNFRSEAHAGSDKRSFTIRAFGPNTSTPNLIEFHSPAAGNDAQAYFHMPVRIGGDWHDMSMVTGHYGDYRLFVKDGILTEKVKVALRSSADWADFVFEDDYELMPIDELEAFIAQEKHLPGVPSAEEMVDSGLDVAKTDAMLMQKIEELNLYIISLQNQIDELKKND